MESYFGSLEFLQLLFFLPIKVPVTPTFYIIVSTWSVVLCMTLFIPSSTAISCISLLIFISLNSSFQCSHCYCHWFIRHFLHLYHSSVTCLSDFCTRLLDQRLLVYIMQPYHNSVFSSLPTFFHLATLPDGPSCSFYTLT